jgi:hypothetical protein
MSKAEKAWIIERRKKLGTSFYQEQVWGCVLNFCHFLKGLNKGILEV